MSCVFAMQISVGPCHAHIHNLHSNHLPLLSEGVPVYAHACITDSSGDCKSTILKVVNIIKL